MTEPGHLPETEFQQIEEFISRTPRGREFLREHTRRAQTGVAEEVRVRQEAVAIDRAAKTVARTRLPRGPSRGRCGFHLGTLGE